MSVSEHRKRSQPHERDYLERTIATVRQHQESENAWPQWANIFADEIERLWAENETWGELGDLMLDALLLIIEGPADPALKADAAWAHGVACAALTLLEERRRAWEAEHSSVPRFLPKHLGGQADSVDGGGVRLRHPGASS